MSKKIEHSHDKIIKNNSFGNGTQIADVIVNNSVKQEEQQDRAVYKPEPVWRSPFTLAVLTWMSCIIGILSLPPLGKMIRSVITLFSGSLETLNTNDIQISSMAFVVLFLLLMIILIVRRIANL